MRLKGSDGVETLPLFVAAGRLGRHEEPDAGLPPMPTGDEVIHDCRSLNRSLKAHPVSFLHETLTQKGIVSAALLRDIPAGRIVPTAGVVFVRQRPRTVSGVVFASLEEETGLANIIVWAKVFEQFRRVVLGSRMMGLILARIACADTLLRIAVGALSRICWRCVYLNAPVRFGLEAVTTYVRFALQADADLVAIPRCHWSRCGG